MDEGTFELVMGITPVVIGIALIYWIGRRKFYRRSMTGAEGFSSYESSIVIRFIERLGKWVAYILIIIGLVFIWSHFQMKKEKDSHTEEVILESFEHSKIN